MMNNPNLKERVHLPCGPVRVAVECRTGAWVRHERPELLELVLRERLRREDEQRRALRAEERHLEELRAAPPWLGQKPSFK